MFHGAVYEFIFSCEKIKIHSKSIYKIFFHRNSSFNMKISIFFRQYITSCRNIHNTSPCSFHTHLYIPPFFHFALPIYLSLQHAISMWYFVFIWFECLCCRASSHVRLGRCLHLNVLFLWQLFIVNCMYSWTKHDPMFVWDLQSITNYNEIFGDTKNSLCTMYNAHISWLNKLKLFHQQSNWVYVHRCSL